MPGRQYHLKRRQPNNGPPSSTETPQTTKPKLDAAAAPDDKALATVKAARLATTVRPEDDPRITEHTISGPDGPRIEIWEHDKFLGCGGFGTVYRETRTAPCGGAGPQLRAVKQLPKPSGEASMSGELMRELEGLLFFKGPIVSFAACPYHAMLLRVETDPEYAPNSINTVLSRLMDDMRPRQPSS